MGYTNDIKYHQRSNWLWQGAFLMPFMVSCLLYTAASSAAISSVTTKPESPKLETEQVSIISLASPATHCQAQSNSEAIDSGFNSSDTLYGVLLAAQESGIEAEIANTRSIEPPPCTEPTATNGH